MAKVKSGIFGNAITGKSGNVVFSTLNGEQIMKAYQPNVTNPNTPLQISQRSRFSLAVGLAKRLRTEMSKMYGTSKVQNFGAINKIILSSPVVRSFNGLSNKLTGIAEAVIFKSGELKSTPNLINTYSPEGLNIFEYGATLRFRNPGTLPTGLLKSHFTLGLQVLVDGDWEDVDGQKLYFGCDYELGSNLVLAGLQKSGVSVTSGVNLVVSNPDNDEGVTAIKVVENEEFIGYRQRGFMNSPINCGKGWKYVYECTVKLASLDFVTYQHAQYGDFSQRYDNFIPSLTLAVFTARMESNPTILPLTMFNAVPLTEFIQVAIPS